MFWVFHNVCMHLGSFRNCMKLGAKQGVFRSIWVHLGSFRKYMKVGAKHTELVQLMQKIVPRTRDVIFRNQRT